MVRGEPTQPIFNRQSPIDCQQPFVLVIFGASGDLARRKLIPAIFSLFQQKLLPDDFRIVGVGRSNYDDAGFRARMAEARPGNATDGEWAQFAAKLEYVRLDYERLDDFHLLRRRIESSGRTANALFYLAVPPDMIGSISDRLGESGLARRGTTDTPWSRIIVEKPFGRDPATARELNARLSTVFSENQIFRIDHYLGKETVQNLLVLRFANSIFEPIWNHKYVDHVQITVSEAVGVEGRGAYYEKAGALRDMVQNHLMHLLCLVAMEPPGSLAPDAVRDEKVKVLRALRPIPRECAANGVVRAQYGPGNVRGERVCGYLEEKDVAPDSRTETFVAFSALIDNWRWSGVPFYLRTGKRMPVRVTEISVHFKAVPQVLFNAAPFGPMAPNVLAIRIQPNEGISLRFQVKVPGPAMRIRPFQMDFGYKRAFGSGPPDAYERLLLDAMLGDPTLFTRRDEIEAAWAFIAPIIEGCEGRGPLPFYPAGTWGPREADALIEADGRAWYLTRRRPAGGC